MKNDELLAAVIFAKRAYELEGYKQAAGTMPVPDYMKMENPLNASGRDLAGPPVPSSIPKPQPQVPGALAGLGSTLKNFGNATLLKGRSLLGIQGAPDSGVGAFGGERGRLPTIDYTPQTVGAFGMTRGSQPTPQPANLGLQGLGTSNANWQTPPNPLAPAANPTGGMPSTNTLGQINRPPLQQLGTHPDLTPSSAGVPASPGIAGMSRSPGAAPSAAPSAAPALPNPAQPTSQQIHDFATATHSNYNPHSAGDVASMQRMMAQAPGSRQDVTYSPGQWRHLQGQGVMPSQMARQ